nr:hypothetical protein [Fusobacterium ulcerans]
MCGYLNALPGVQGSFEIYLYDEATKKETTRLLRVILMCLWRQGINMLDCRCKDSNFTVDYTEYPMHGAIGYIIIIRKIGE